MKFTRLGEFQSEVIPGLSITKIGKKWVSYYNHRKIRTYPTLLEAKQDVLETEEGITAMFFTSYAGYCNIINGFYGVE